MARCLSTPFPGRGCNKLKAKEKNDFFVYFVLSIVFDSHIYVEFRGCVCVYVCALATRSTHFSLVFNVFFLFLLQFRSIETTHSAECAVHADEKMK